ncbi:phosphoglucomutase 2 isoform X2 [Lycorma delicatula]
MGCGYSQMNDLVIIQTSQGLLEWLKNVTPHRPKVIIGYDGRHHSKRFAELAAAVFVHGETDVYLFSKLVPTPFVSFATELIGDLGIMVTASHNPKDDNGYKVYWKKGVQINAPFDFEIQESIKQNLEPKPTSWNTCVLNNNVTDPLIAVMETYYSNIWDGPCDSNADVVFTYTAMHGVGYPYIVEAFRRAKLRPVIPVVEQIEPDPEFPTVKFPNPEEGKSAMELAMKTADENGSTVILANDPDADRLALAEKTRSGEWKVFTGNEIGTLLGWWCLHAYKERNKDIDNSRLCFLSSAVSSKVLQTIAKAEGLYFEDTLTGFKWIAQRAVDLTSNDYTVLFAFEEAIGFMCGVQVKDKDGISAALCSAKLATTLYSQGKTLCDKLHEIYQQYGHHLTENSYFICDDPAIIRAIFHRLNHFKGCQNTYPDNILSGKYKIEHVRDLILGHDTTQPDNKPYLPVSSSNPMITFTFSNGLCATIRASGTEPKIKYYTELCGPSHIQDVNILQELLREMVDAIIFEFLQPEENGLIARIG